MSLSINLKKKLAEFLKRLLDLRSEKSVVETEREGRKRGREKAARASGGKR